MGRERFWWTALALVLAASPLAAFAAGEYGDIRVAVEMLPSDDPMHGYRTAVGRIANRGFKDHEVGLSLRSLSSGIPCELVGVSRSLVVSAQSEVAVQLLFPATLSCDFYQCDVFIDGRRQRKPVEATARQSGARGSYRMPGTAGAGVLQVLVSQRANRDAMERAISTGSSRTPVLGGGGPQLLRAEWGVDGWPTRWLAYSAYDGVMLTAAEWSGAPEPVRNALWRYAEAGGALLVLGVVELPTACRVLNKFPNAPDSGQRPECVCYEVTLGRCYVFRNAEAPDRAGARNWAGNAERMLGSAWQRQRSAADTHRVAPVIEEISTPFWSCFGVLSLFSILAGPVAIGVLRNRNRGIWIFWLAPVLGLLTSVIVILSVILGEGVTPSASVAGFTVLDERVGRATTVGINGFYCPVRLRKGLAYSYDTEVTSCRAGDTPFSAAIVPRELVWGERQLLPGQWVRPRIPQYLRLRTNELRKERLGLVRGPDGLSVVNGLGADISRLLVVDFDGRIYEMLDVAAGSQVVARSPLKQAEELRRRDLPTVQPLGSVILEREAWQPKVADVLQWSGLMRPGSYLAYMDSAPFVPNGIQRSAKLMESSIVFGILREEDGQ